MEIDSYGTRNDYRPGAGSREELFKLVLSRSELVTVRAGCNREPADRERRRRYTASRIAHVRSGHRSNARPPYDR